MSVANRIVRVKTFSWLLLRTKEKQFPDIGLFAGRLSRKTWIASLLAMTIIKIVAGWFIPMLFVHVFHQSWVGRDADHHRESGAVKSSS